MPEVNALISRTCAWCGDVIHYSGRGRPPRFCSKAHRNRAWEVRTAEQRLGRDLAVGTATAEPVREIIVQTQVLQPRFKTPVDLQGWIDMLNELISELRSDSNMAVQFVNKEERARLSLLVTALEGALRLAAHRRREYMPHDAIKGR